MIMPDPLKLLVVFVHIDDESMGMGGTLAKYSAQGVETNYICAPRGERGWFGSEQQNPSLGALAEMHTDVATDILAMQATFYRTCNLVNAGRRIESNLFEGLRLYIWNPEACL
jgi:LmbE family N-acetylglucosaminyl deacetylase